MSRLRGERGDTLVEVVIASSILAVVLVTSFNLANMTFRVGAQAREHVEASQLAQDQVEKLHAYRDRLIADNPGGNNALFAGLTCGGFYLKDDLTPGLGSSPVVDGLFSVTVKCNGAQWPTVFDGNVDVSWTSLLANDQAGNTNHSIVKVMLVDKRGIQQRDCSVAGTPGCS